MCLCGCHRRGGGERGGSSLLSVPFSEKEGRGYEGSEGGGECWRLEEGERRDKAPGKCPVVPGSTFKGLLSLWSVTESATTQPGDPLPAAPRSGHLLWGQQTRLKSWLCHLVLCGHLI